MRNWLRCLRRVVRPSPSALPVSRYRPTLEPLEDRSLLATAFLQTNLIADTAGIAAHTNANLVNPWGISFGPGTDFWLADNGTGLSTLNDATGANGPFFISIPPPSGGTPPSHPTGTVFNGNASEFLVNGPNTSAVFLFATEEGTIAGWYTANATTKVDNSGSGAVYKGLAIASQGNSDFLYATDFHNGHIDVFDFTFAAHTFAAGQFTDPNLPSGYAPFGIQNINGTLFVTYAKQLGPANHDDDPGPGNGFVDEFMPDGTFIKRLVSNGPLNSPWGLAIAPASFGPFAGDLLVGNFGDGTINAFNATTGASLGPLPDANGHPIQIDGLWALTVGNDSGAGASNTLYFTAGPGGETHGLFGSLQAVTITPSPGPGPTPTPTPTPTPILLDVSALVSVAKVLPHNHHPNPHQQKVTLHNNSGTSLNGLFFLIVDGLPKKVRLRNAAGFTQAHGKTGDPFAEIDLSALAAGQSVSFTLLFSNPKNKAVHFTTIVLAGTGTV
jgi:uncharacterized protein (TIGR03118 family)